MGKGKLGYWDICSLPAKSDTAHLRLESAMQKDVDYLLMAKPVVQLTTRGSAVTVLCLLGAVGCW